MRKTNHTNFKWFLSFVAIILIVAGAVFINNNYSKENSDKIEGTISTDNGDLKINWERYPTYSIELSESLNINNSGTYHLTGSLDNGSIVINSGQEGVVKIILDNATIKNSNGPAISCLSADDLVIEITGNNAIEDGPTYSADLNEDITGAIYSKADLTFQGDGNLTILANYQDGIVSKDDLKFSSGTYNITAADDAIRGKDSVYIVGGDFIIDAKADAIKSTNETDIGKGFVLIESGSFNISAKAKGIKAINSILIYDGDFIIDSTDDAIHSNNYVGIVDGNISITSKDDGIHADRELIVEDGTINIKQSYEGIEAQAITINGGDTSILASDDGLNAGGGADSSANNRVGAGAFDADADCVISINNGNLYINAAGDGIDSNGYLYFNGGSVVVDGPTNNGNGALDAGAGIMMNGGKVIAVGASGMAESLGSSSAIYNISVYLSSSQSANTKIKIKDEDGNTIMNHTSAKTFNHMSVGTEEFQYGETYTIYINDELYQSFTISDITTTIGNSNTNQNMMMSPSGNRGQR